MERTRKILALAMAMAMFASGAFGAWTFAEEVPAQAPAAVDQPKEAPPAAPKTDPPAPEVTAAPEKPAATPAPEPTAVPVPTSAPEATNAPVAEDATAAPTQAVSETPDGDTGEVPDARPTADSESTTEPLPTLEAVLDATVEPAPSEAPASGFELLKKSKSFHNNHLNASGLTIPSDGMPIPLIYQRDYQRAVCIVEGEYKSAASSGCGAAAASMLIAYIAQNYDQTPYTLFYWAASHGRYAGSGLEMESVQQMLANYGVSSRIEGVSADAIVGALKENRPIIMLMGSGTFTQNGHYIVLRGLDENGMVLVNDPNSSGRSATAYAPQLIAREAKGGVMLVASAAKPRSEESAAPEVETAIQATPTLAEVQNEMAEATPAPQPVREESDGQSAYIAQVCVDCVNLRTEIGKRGKIAAQIQMGERVQVVEEKTLSSGNVWCRVIYQGQELFMRGDMLEKIG